jgi:acyl-CoA synthetase (AMP-forming)/AMP-acid ligase II
MSDTRTMRFSLPEEALVEPFGNISDLIALNAKRSPAHLALIEGERRVDYATFAASVERVAAALIRDGLRVGDTLALCAANSIEYALVFFGALRAGVAVAPIPQLGTASIVARMVVDSRARHLFLDGATAALIEPMRDAVAARRIAIDESDTAESLEDWLLDVPTQPPPVTIAPDTPFNIIYSSGTTGVPKGIVQPHSMRWAQLRRGPTYGYRADTVTLNSTPLHSNTTLVSFLPTLALGGTVVLMPKFDAGGYLALAEHYRVTHAMLVPVQYARILAQPDFERYDLSSFRMKFCTSAPFAAAMKRDALARWPGGLIEYYGMTEGGGTCILLAHEHPDKLHTVGPPAAGHDMRTIDENGRELPRGEVGEVVGHSVAMMTGYHRQPELTSAAEWFDDEGRRFIRTGDIGRFDEDGFLILLDRRKDMIISGGFNVYPSDLEAVLREHPGVLEVAVIGVESQAWGETPVAFVVAKPGHARDEAALLQWTNSSVAKVQRLAAVRFIDELPRSAIGKVLKRELREAFARSRSAQDAPL